MTCNILLIVDTHGCIHICINSSAVFYMKNLFSVHFFFLFKEPGTICFRFFFTVGSAPNFCSCSTRKIQGTRKSMMIFPCSLLCNPLVVSCIGDCFCQRLIKKPIIFALFLLHLWAQSFSLLISVGVSLI